jgi:hypothetical protein
MLDELRKLPTCLTNFSAEEKRALDEWQREKAAARTNQQTR